MFRHSLSWYIFAFTLLESIIKTHLTVYDSSHGFITNNHRYFDEEMSAIHGMSGLGNALNPEDGSSTKLLLRFEPAVLDFKRRPLGVPHLEKVTLFNVDANRSIDMTSISGSTVHFHSSFFEDKKIPPLGNTSFNVVFLGRQEGYVESSLFIHTNEGHFKYDVKGSSVHSPYRLRPIVGVKIAVNTTFSPVIHVHNPHDVAIQIVEIYSSGGDFHLELPSGELEGPKDMWEIPPSETKAVIRVRFHAKTEQNHTSYVRIKLNNTDEILVVPLEVEVTSSGNLFNPQGLLDFGVGGSMDPPKDIELCLHNPFKKAVKIHSVTTASKAISIYLENTKLQPDGKDENGCFLIGKLVVDWKTAFEKKDYSGKIIVKYKTGRAQTEIPYYLTVLEGGLSYSGLVTRYFVNENAEKIAARNFRIRNDFKSPVKLLSVSLPDIVQKYFIISNFKPLVLKPGRDADAFAISMKPGVNVAELKVNSYILLRSNISTLGISLLSYNGKLNLHLPFRSDDYQWDLGLLSTASTKDIKFMVHNTNPVGVKIRSVKTSIPMSTITILGCSHVNYSVALLQPSFRNLTKCDTLMPNDYAIMQLLVKTSNNEGQIWGDVQLETNFENHSVPVLFKVAPGKLEILPERFEDCFPGKICSHPLKIRSSFNDPMIIESIFSLPPDPRFSVRHSSHIHANSEKSVGYLYLDPSLGCNTQCYTGMQHDTTAQWLKTLSVWKSLPNFDLNLVNVFYNRYLNLTYNGHKKWQNLTLRLDTTEVKGQTFHSLLRLVWPSVIAERSSVNKTVFDFPLTQIGNITYQDITVHNPSSNNLILQIVLDKFYPEMDLLLEGLPANFLPVDLSSHKTKKHNFFFHKRHKEDVEEFRSLFNMNVHAKSIPVFLMPDDNFTFSVGFKGEDTEPQSALILIRNNLTIIEVLRLNGQGSNPVFKFGNRKPGAFQPLTFELTEKHLKDCEKEKLYKNPSPNLTVKRSFTARNIGEVTVFVNSFHINGYPCEGYGFKVLNCSPFVLHPNGTKKIDIAFTPDLTLTKIVRTLVLDTSLGYPVNYTLQTTVPAQYLGLCSNIIIRPDWEAYLSYLCIGLMSFCLVSLMIIAFVDASKIRSQSSGVFASPTNSSTHPVLDLRLVGQQTRSEIRTSKPETRTNQTDQRADPKVENVISDFDLADEPVKPKATVDKSVTASTMVRTKKKVSKKNSNESSNQVEILDQKKTVSEPQKISKPKTEEKCEEKKPLIPPKKSITNVKKSVKNIAAPTPYEEETSSTTTESSSNNDEAEKENEQRNVKSCSKKLSNKPTFSTDESISRETPSQSTQGTNKPERRKSGQRNTQKVAKGDAHDKSDHHHKPNGENRRSHKNSRERRDKQSLSKKSSADKNRLCETKNCDNRTNLSARVSPTISSNIWTENKASFSDVVARSDSSNIRPIGHNPTSKPTMYVEPYKQTAPPLGPIGSRREFGNWQDSENVSFNNTSSDEPTNQLSNSYFSNSQDVSVDTSQPFLQDLISGDNWSRPPTLMNLIESNICSGRQDTWNQSNNTTSYWNNSFGLVSNTVPVQQHQPSQQSQPQPFGNDQSGYLWGSSPVWAWAPPEASRTPTRTPPGFDAVLQRNREEQTSQQRETFNPFNTTNIWTERDNYPWDYSQQ